MVIFCPVVLIVGSFALESIVNAFSVPLTLKVLVGVIVPMPTLPVPFSVTIFIGIPSVLSLKNMSPPSLSHLLLK